MFKDQISDIFFDLDHTLWDFEKNSALTFQKIISKNQLDINVEDFLKVYTPINLEYWKLYRENQVSKSELRYQRLKRSFDAIGSMVSDEQINVLADEYIIYLSTFTNLISGAVEVLEYLNPKYHLHIITNGFQEVQVKKLKGGNIHHYFNEIVDSETAGVKKPHPQIFEMALQLAKVNPKNALMVGDNLEADIIGAVSVGMNALHFNFHKESEHGKCKMINNLFEIKSIL
ncbi:MULTISPECIES: YjjG family noncanonical pyrimidine nucleotidase [Flavobacteriaceae]|uniref:YjjG family noncanonical pyrimidine nucleotidase n=1 Tax=Flavobacteriaceae TaxID=49546 RepID=UPI0014931E56|nr:MULTISPECIES: YjjG family noncanonical pyrimidine nucleotidase [Allomuricauda]MDC6366564.1 YjjG family noncanonical pyrimidine nucleotidase [Muricauda sp. AC10]